MKKLKKLSLTFLFIATALISTKIVLGLADGSSWTEQGTDALPVATQYQTSVIFNNKMWVIGGASDGSTFSRKVYSSSNGTTWTEAGTNALPAAIIGHTSVVFNNKMWLFGGYNSSFAFTHKIYSSPDGITWTESGTNALPMAHVIAATVYNNKMWLIGGFNDSFALVHNVYSSTDGINWVQEGNSVPVADNFLVTVYNNKMWLVGGRDNSFAVSRKVFYSTDGSTWTEAGTNSLAAGTINYSSVVYNNKLWMIGGSITNNGSTLTRKVYSTTDGITWVESGTNALPVATYTHTSLVYDNQIWVIGGKNASAVVRKVYFTSDSTPPSVSNISPASGSSTADATPTVTFDTDELASCRLSLTDESYASMSDDVSCSGSGTTSQSCNVPNLGSDGSKTVYVACTDNYGNADTSGTNEEITYTLDTTAPTGSDLGAESPDSHTADNSKYTKSHTITINPTAFDASYMMISESPDFIGASWESYSSSKSFTLSDGNGLKTIYIKYKDSADNQTEATTDTITLDTKQPKKFKIGLSKDNLVTLGKTVLDVPDKKVKLYFDAYDSTTSVESIKISEKKDMHDASWKKYDGSVQVKLNGDADKHKLYIQFRDKAGNDSDKYTQVLNISGTASGMSLQKMGSIEFSSRYKNYYYTENAILFSGKGHGKIQIDGKLYETTKNGDGWNYFTILNNGQHTIKVGDTDVTIILDPTSESFPQSLK